MWRRKAFTLIELLVVIAIIAVLISIIIPALHMARKKAAGAACMANVKTLSLGWFMYQLDNGGRILSQKQPDFVQFRLSHPCLRRTADKDGRSHYGMHDHPYLQSTCLTYPHQIQIPIILASK